MEQKTTARKPKHFEIDDQDIGQPTPRTLSSEGGAILSGKDFTVVDGPEWESKAAELAFLEEPVTVIVSDTTDPHGEKIIHLGCNGRNQFIIRGEETTIKRKFVGILASARQESFTEEEYTDFKGARAVRYTPHLTLKYHFTVIRDDNPRGRDWLRTMLKQK